MNDVDGLGHWRADLARHRHGIRGADAAQGCDGEGETMSDELAQGGNGGPEIIFLPKGAQVYPQKQDQPGQQFNIMIMPFKNTQELRAFVQAIVRETLEEDARAIRERKEFQPVKQAGTCCACLMAGDDMEWVGNRLAHKTDECRRIAAEMEPVREHRG